MKRGRKKTRRHRFNHFASRQRVQQALSPSKLERQEKRARMREEKKSYLDEREKFFRTPSHAASPDARKHDLSHADRKFDLKRVFNDYSCEQVSHSCQPLTRKQYEDLYQYAWTAHHK
jgi:hypothetical protein